MHRLAVGFVLGATGMYFSSGAQTRMVRADATVDFPSIAALTTEIVTVDMPGAEVGDVVLCNASESLGTTALLGTCTVLTPDTVSIKAANLKSTASVDPKSQTVHVTLFKAGH